MGVMKVKRLHLPFRPSCEIEGSRTVTGSRLRTYLLVAILAVHVGLLCWMARSDSATWDEVGHIAAGISHCTDQTFNLYRVNPPLVRTIGCLPVLLLRDARLELGGRQFVRDSTERLEFECGEQLARANGPRFFLLLTVSRWISILFSVLGGAICFVWAQELYGRNAALVSLLIWAFSPSVLAYGHLLVPDLGAAGLGVTAAYIARRWIMNPTASRAIAAGLLLGLAVLTKTTWLFLFVLWPVLWIACGRMPRAWLSESAQLVLIPAIALWVVNLGYGFERSFKPLGEYQFLSAALGGADRTHLRNGHWIGNRAAGSWLGRLPVPLPENFVLGIDYIKFEYERKYWSYLRGEWRFGGWWYYYLYAMLVKEPLGTWALGLIALGATALNYRTYARPWSDELMLLAPATVIIALVSSQTGFNHHLRYVLPAYPFLFIWISKAARSFDVGDHAVAALVVACVGWTVMTSLRVVPHSMSYFNELAGGPKNGHWHLGNSNTDWGQDLLHLKWWHERNSEARPLYLGYDLPLIDPEIVGIKALALPALAHQHSSGFIASTARTAAGPMPGWHAVSVNWLHDRQHRYAYFNDLEPVEWVGYTIPIYHITFEQANSIRRKYRLPELLPPSTSGKPEEPS